MAQNRINKINDQLMREISTIIRELKDSRIPLMTSVISVSATNDLRYAKVRISVMGDQKVQRNGRAEKCGGIYPPRGWKPNENKIQPGNNF